MPDNSPQSSDELDFIISEAMSLAVQSNSDATYRHAKEEAKHRLTQRELLSRIKEARLILDKFGHFGYAPPRQVLENRIAQLESQLKKGAPNV